MPSKSAEILHFIVRTCGWNTYAALDLSIRVGPPKDTSAGGTPIWLHIHSASAITALDDDLLQLGDIGLRRVKGHLSATGNSVHAYVFDPVFAAERPLELAHTVIAAHSRDRDLAGLQRLTTLHRFNLI